MIDRLHSLHRVYTCCLGVSIFTWTLLLPSAAQEAPVLRKSPANAIQGNVKKQSEAISVDAQRRLDLERTSVEYSQVLKEGEFAPFLSLNMESQKVDLDLKKMRGYFQKKQEANDERWKELERKIENARQPELERRARVLAKWDRAMNDTKSRVYSTRNGTLFNFFLDQIEVHAGFSSSGDLSPGLVSGLKRLDDNVLRGLKFEVTAPGGAIEVSMTNPLPSVLRTSPYLLLDPQFKDQRERVTTLAAQVLGSHASAEDKYSLSEDYIQAFEALTTSFYLKYPDSARKKISMTQWHRLDAVDAYFRKLDQTVSRAAEGAVDGAVRPVYTDIYAPEQRNLATLCQFLIQNGIRFAKPTTDGEFIYDQLFPQFRELMVRLDVEPDQAWMEDSLINLDLEKEVRNEP